MTDVVLCIDIGTTSLKAGLITADGEVVSTSSAKVLFNEEEKSFIATKWKKAFLAALKKLSSSVLQIKSKEKYFIKAFSISGNGPTLVTENGRTELWNDDFSFGLKLMNLMTAEADIHSHSLFVPKILSLKNKYKEDFDSSKYVFSGPEYFIYQLTNTAITILPEERYISAYWDSSLLELCGIPTEKMPPYCRLGEKIASVQKSVKDEILNALDSDSLENLVFPEDIPVYGAGPDFIAALIGTNTLSPGRICDRSGSSEGINYCVSSCVYSYGVRTLPSVIGGLWNVSVLIPRSGKLSENKRIFVVGEALKTLRSISRQNGFPFPQKLFVTGGQTKNSGYMKRKSKELNMKLSVANCDDAELLGDACVAYYALNVYDSIQDAALAIVKEKDFNENL